VNSVITGVSFTSAVNRSVYRNYKLIATLWFLSYDVNLLNTNFRLTDNVSSTELTINVKVKKLG